MVQAEASLTSRLLRTQDLLSREGVDVLLVAPSADMVYLSGYGRHASERPVLLAIPPTGSVLMVLPHLEAPRVNTSQDMRIIPYGETDDPVAIVADALSSSGTRRRIAVSDEMRAAVLLRLQAALPGVEWEPGSLLLRELRMRKSPDELEMLARAGSMADKAFEALIQLRFSGRTERDIGDELASLLRQQALLDAGWGPIVASGPNAASPHHSRGDREIHEGDALVLDFGGTVGGYQADITRTVHVGSPGEDFVRVYDAVKAAQEAGVRACSAGATAESVDHVTRAVITDAGYGEFFIHRTGHGVGLDEHEDPYIVAGNTLPLESGMTFSIEPGIYLPGRFGVRIEDVVCVTAEGPRRLNNASRDLIVVH